MLPYLAREELAKLPLLIAAAMRLAGNQSVDWKRFNARFNSHPMKWDVVAVEYARNRRVSRRSIDEPRWYLALGDFA